MFLPKLRSAKPRDALAALGLAALIAAAPAVQSATLEEKGYEIAARSDRSDRGRDSGGRQEKIAGEKPVVRGMESAVYFGQ